VYQSLTNPVPINYDPHPAQQPFHEQREWWLWRALIGGTASGKTEAGAAEALYWAILYPGSIGAMYEPNYPMLNRILIPKLDKLLGAPFWKSDIVKTYRRAENHIILKRDPTANKESEIWLNSLQEPERAEGQNLDWVYIDEARLVPKLDLALQVTGRRLRGSGNGTPLGGWLTTTPDSPGSTLYKFLENPKTRDPTSHIFRMSIFDNPHLPQSYLDNMKQVHSGGLAERFLYGRFADVGAGTYPFDYSVHVMDAPMERIKSVVYGVDFGWTNPSVILAIGFDGDGRAYVLDECYKPQLSDIGLVYEARTISRRYGSGWFICDRTEPKTIMELSRAGLMAKGDTSKFDDGIREVGGRLIKSGDGRCRLYISPNCFNLIEEIQLYDVSKPKGSQRDHACDALRYALASTMMAVEPGFIFE
jgi:phage terminase large subunit-like protein